jgi:hypothetical protein
MKYSISQTWKIVLCLFHFELGRGPFVWYLHLETVLDSTGHAVEQLVDAICYKPEGIGIESR